MEMKKLLIALLLAPLPALAQIHIDNDKSSPPSLPPGIAWLEHQPVTLFDLGLMELTHQASAQMRR